MNYPSGNYTAQISSEFYCFGGDDCAGDNQTLQWNCNSQNCSNFVLSGTIPKPKYTIGSGSPIVDITMPQIPSSLKWNTAVGTLTNPKNDCAEGQVQSINNQQISFKIGNDGPPICENTIISANIESQSSCHLKCHRIPFTDWAWCYKDNSPHCGTYLKF